MQRELNTNVLELSAILGCPIDINNNYELRNILNSNNISINSFDLKKLKSRQYDNEALMLLFKSKDLNHKLNVFSINRLKSKADENNRIHADWHIASETTGRLVCSNPPLQGMPRTSRKYFIAEPNHCLITGDYSNMEMRVLAKLCNDEALISDLQIGKDIHKQTASAIFNVPICDVTDEQRQFAKSVNFLICYGGTAYGLSKRLTAETGYIVSVDEAQRFINAFYCKYPTLYYYHYSLLNQKIEPTTLKGRVYENIYGSKALNYPVQASASEGFIEVLTEIVKTMPSNYKLVMAIHDSVTLEVPVDEIDNAENFLKTTMETVMGKFFNPVPVFIEITN